MSVQPPIMTGYTVTRDDTTGEWVATLDSNPAVQLRGRTHRALVESRWKHVCGLADELSAILRSSTWHGYPLPEPSPDS